MKTITRKVSLEPLITRYPVCYPSIKDGVIHYLSLYDLEKTENAHYGCIPLGIDEYLTDPYSGFTMEMGVSYSGQTIFCYTLQQWMNEFEDYYNLLRSNECNIVFNSADEYYSRTYPNDYKSTYAEIAKELDDNFKRHGGERFYKWLIDYYFIMLDFKGEYSSVSGSCSYNEWCEYIDNIGVDRMPLPAAVEFFGKMSRLHSKYSGSTCQDSDDCCECVDYYRFGGDTMYEFLYDWMERIRLFMGDVKDNISDPNRRIEVYHLIPNTYINFQLTEKIEDFGVFVSFSQEFIPGHTYECGDVCDYDGTTYIMVNEDKKYNETYFATKIGDDTYWNEYYENAVSSLQSTLELGSISDLGGSNPWIYESSTTKLRTKQGTYLNLFKGDTIRLSDYTNAEMYIGCDGDYTKGSQEWLRTDFIVPANGRYVVLLTNVEEEEVTVEGLGSRLQLKSNRLIDAAYIDVDYSKLDPFSGRTDSSLTSFQRKSDTIDVMGNVLPGHFRPNPQSYVVQPAKNSLLDFIYEPGTYINKEVLSNGTIEADRVGYIENDGSVSGNPEWRHTIMIDTNDFISATWISSNGTLSFYSSGDLSSYVGQSLVNKQAINEDDFSVYLKQYPTAKYVILSTNNTTLTCKFIQKYVCDFLDRIEFFYLSLENDVVFKTVAGVGDNVNEKIIQCKETADYEASREPYSASTQNTGVMYADFYYYKSSIVSVSANTPTSQSGYTMTKVADHDYEFVDHCTIDESVCQYHISETYPYPLRYYKVNMNTETRFSYEHDKTVSVDMCDFIFNISKMTPMKHKATPLFRKEELLPFVNAEIPVDNIYIDRGYTTVLDRRLRLGEITSYEQLEKYGNGIFKFPDDGEDYT